jgi:hypothetical protein
MEDNDFVERLVFCDEAFCRQHDALLEYGVVTDIASVGEIPVSSVF